VLAQYAPYHLAEGDWEGRQAEIGRLILEDMAAFAPDLPDCVAEYSGSAVGRRSTDSDRQIRRSVSPSRRR
jgi:hypothetical protein